MKDLAVVDYFSGDYSDWSFPCQSAKMKKTRNDSIFLELDNFYGHPQVKVIKHVSIITCSQLSLNL